MLTTILATPLIAATLPIDPTADQIPADAATGDRQRYGMWHHHRGHGYHYRSYYFKPSAADTKFRHHRCIHHPSRPRYVYFYSPYTARYWGRFDTRGKPGARFSVLKEEHRRRRLTDIPESTFPAPGAMPSIPESEDNVAIEPPRDLPTAVE